MSYSLKKHMSQLIVRRGRWVPGTTGNLWASPSLGTEQYRSLHNRSVVISVQLLWCKCKVFGYELTAEFLNNFSNHDYTGTNFKVIVLYKTCTYI